jgi:hypothetical protein
MHATDGAIGHVDDFLVDDRCQIRYLLVDTSNWIGGKWVAVSIGSVTGIDWSDQVIHVALSREQVKASPSADEANVPPHELTPFTIM